jgi:hypothetical protein
MSVMVKRLKPNENPPTRPYVLVEPGAESKRITHGDGVTYLVAPGADPQGALNVAADSAEAKLAGVVYVRDRE